MDTIGRKCGIIANINRISEGIVSLRITENYGGDLVQCLAAINLLVNDSRELFDAIIDGKINQRADIINCHGEFRNVISGVNSALDRLTGLIGEILITVQVVDKLK